MDREQIFRIILACLRFTVKKEPLPEGTAELIDEACLEALYSASDPQDLAHLVGFALKENRLLIPGSAASSSFEKKILFALYRSERIEHEKNSLCALLEEAEIRHIALKGSVIRAFYPETWMRTSADADVLIPKDKLEEAVALLSEKRGYVLLERGSHDISFAAPGGMHMELHFGLVERARMPEAVEILEKVWDYAEPVEGKRYEKKLPPAFFLFYHIVHMAKHMNNGGVGIRFFLDYYLIREPMHPDEAHLSHLLEKGRVDVFEKNVCDLGKAWMEGTDLSPRARLLQSFVFSTGIFGEQQSYVAIRRGRKGKMRYLVGRLFAPYETLRQVYPGLEGKRYLLPLYQLRRILDHIRFGRMKKSVREIKENLSLSSAESSRMAQLLSEMDLHFHD